MVIDAITLLFFPALMAFAASSDLITMTISNRVSLALIAGFVVLALTTGMSLAGIGWHLGAGVLVLIVVFGFFSRGWIGGGDAKLAAATVLWLGLAHLADYLFYASIFGGVLTLMIIYFRRVPLPQVFVGRPWAERLHRSDNGVPYGIALAVAALLIYPHTNWMTSL